MAWFEVRVEAGVTDDLRLGFLVNLAVSLEWVLEDFCAPEAFDWEEDFDCEADEEP